MKMNIRGTYDWVRRSRDRNPSKPPLLLKYRSSRGFVITTVCIAVFNDVLLYSVAVPVIPFALTERARVPLEDVQYWSSILLAGYGGAATLASPICGWVADRCTSRRLSLIFGLLALAWSTVMLCIGSSTAVLLVGRILQGVSAAIVWGVGLALLADTVGRNEIGQVMGYVFMSQSIAILIGPFLGGVVYARFGYYAVFEMAFGLIFVDIVLRLALIEKKVAAEWIIPQEMDNDGKPPPYPGLSDPEKCEPTIVRINECDSFEITPSTRVRHKLPPVLTLLKSRRLLVALFGSFVQATLMSAFDGVLPLFVHRTFQWSPTGAGLIFLPLAAPAFAGPLAGWACDRFGPRWLAAVGFLLAVPFLVLLRLVTHHSLSQVVLLCSLLVLVGICMTLVMPPLMAEIMYVVEAKETRNPGLFGKQGAYAQAYGLFFCAFSAGLFVGPIFAGLVEQKAGWGTMAWSLGLLSGVCAILVLLWIGGFIRTRHVRLEHMRKLDEKTVEWKLDDAAFNAFRVWVKGEVARLDSDLDLHLTWASEKGDNFVTYIV